MPSPEKIYYPTMPGYTWNQALSQCQSNGSDLVSVHSEMENSFLYGISLFDFSFISFSLPEGLIVNTRNPDGKNHNFWTGLQLTRSSSGAVTGSKWSDGTPMDYGDPVTTKGIYPWATGEPINGRK